MDAATDKIINRVKKLMALANDPAASDGERDNALRMAHATMLKYNLDGTALEGAPTGPKEERLEFRMKGYGRPWAVSLAHTVADAFLCKYVFRRCPERDTVEHCFIGKESNAVAAAEVALGLINSVWKEARRRQRDLKVGAEWRRSFCTGAMFKVQERCRALKTSTQLEGGSTCTALVVANLYQVELAENTAWMAARMQVRAVKSRAKSTLDAEATAQGRTFGNTLNLTASGQRKLS